MLHSSARLLLLTSIVVALCSCSFPAVYKLDIQQGNIITQDRVDQLKPGMSKRQVRFLMGTPLLVDSFNENRWDYFYSLKNNDDAYSKERLTMYFVDDQLHHMQGNFRPGDAPVVTAALEDVMDAGRVRSTRSAQNSIQDPSKPVIPEDGGAQVYPVPETRVQEIEPAAPSSTEATAPPAQ
jgi:outer membrane protein assembly factor BamE